MSDPTSVMMKKKIIRILCSREFFQLEPEQKAIVIYWLHFASQAIRDEVYGPEPYPDVPVSKYRGAITETILHSIFLDDDSAVQYWRRLRSNVLRLGITSPELTAAIILSIHVKDIETYKQVSSYLDWDYKKRPPLKPEHMEVMVKVLKKIHEGSESLRKRWVKLEALNLDFPSVLEPTLYELFSNTSAPRTPEQQSKHDAIRELGESGWLEARTSPSSHSKLKAFWRRLFKS